VGKAKKKKKAIKIKKSWDRTVPTEKRREERNQKRKKIRKKSFCKTEEVQGRGGGEGSECSWKFLGCCGGVVLVESSLTESLRATRTFVSKPGKKQGEKTKWGEGILRVV